MTAPRPSHVDSEHHSSTSPNSDLTIGHLAHELNSLLDGSMRFLALAQRSLVPVEQGAATAPPTDAMEKLQVANSAMQRMATLLNRAMANDAADFRMFTEHESLGRQVDQIVQLLTPMAEECDVAIHCTLTPKVSNLAAGMLGPIILNSLRNAIQACSLGAGVERRVELSIAITPNASLQLLVIDTGPGAAWEGDDGDETPINWEGHGFGLDLCRRIADGLGGSLSLTNVPFGSGAILQVSIPLRSFQHG